MKIVVGVDGSKYGRWALDWVTSVPLTSKADVTAVHALDLGALRAPFMVQPVVIGNEPFIQAETKRLEAQARQVVADSISRLQELGVKGKALSVRGPVVPSLLKRVPGKNALVILGSRGLDALDRFMIGSVSTQVIHHAPCSVLVVKTAARPVQRMMLATDGSKASERALQFLLRTVSPRPARPDQGEGPREVAVMHVMPFLRYPELKDVGRAIVHYAADKLRKAGFAVEEVARLGNPADEIIKEADRRNVDLLVAGAKGLGAIARFFVGSVTTKLLHHSSCSVLVVR